jgi:hypothetical protein
MNDTERMRMTELCSAIATEQDSGKMLDLVAELNRLFELKEARLKQKQRGSSPSTSEEKNPLLEASDCLPGPNDSRLAS